MTMALDKRIYILAIDLNEKTFNLLIDELLNSLNHFNSNSHR